MATIALGSSSWQFDAWRGVFYPEQMKPAAYLAHYARHLRTVEVNTTFYAIPRQSTVQRWIEHVPDGFTFWFSEGGISGSASTSPCIMAPVYMPIGVTATTFYATFVDNDASLNMSVTLRQLDHYSGTSTAISTLTSAGQSANPQNVSDAVSFTTSTSYTYYLTTCMPATSSTRIINARIWY